MNVIINAVITYLHYVLSLHTCIKYCHYMLSFQWWLLVAMHCNAMYVRMRVVKTSTPNLTQIWSLVQRGLMMDALKQRQILKCWDSPVRLVSDRGYRLRFEVCLSSKSRKIVLCMQLCV